MEQLARVPQLLSLCSGAREPQVLKPVSTRAHASQPEKLLQEEARTLHGAGIPDVRKGLSKTLTALNPTE